MGVTLEKGYDNGAREVNKRQNKNKADEKKQDLLGEKIVASNVLYQIMGKIVGGRELPRGSQKVPLSEVVTRMTQQRRETAWAA